MTPQPRVTHTRDSQLSAEKQRAAATDAPRERKRGRIDKEAHRALDLLEIVERFTCGARDANAGP